MSSIEEELDSYASPSTYEFRPGRDFTVVRVRQQENKHIRIAPEVVDWWSVGSVESRTSQLVKDGALVDLWWKDNNKGLLHTANMLHKVDDERVPLVWLAAFMFDVHHNLPDHWRGDPIMFMSRVENIVRDRLSDFAWWHHAMRNVLPECVTSILRAPAADSEWEERGVYELTQMAWATAAMCLLRHRLVVVRPVEGSHLEAVRGANDQAGAK
jgi:AcrR family transcriptional regulator